MSGRTRALPALRPWERLAACGGQAEAFTAEWPSRVERERMARICAGCRVRVDCAELALDLGNVQGVYAGRYFGYNHPQGPADVWETPERPAHVA